MSRIDVMKTYKLYINGAFPRGESGRVYEVKDSKGKFLANPCQASRKDLREAVVAARAAQPGWVSSTAYLRGQILYRVAEMMESRKSEFIDVIVASEGKSISAATAEVSAAIDMWVWYAGWSDKISTIAGSTNQVSGPYYNFTIPEAIGVVTIFADNKSPLLSLVSAIGGVLTSGNTCVVIASEKSPLTAIALAEVLATSDVPNGVVNILTGKSAEIVPWVGSHMDIDAVDVSGLNKKQESEVRISGADNLKRIHRFTEIRTAQRVLAFVENKTVWHPIGV
jgi:acyl-CoA reductase-like NAD-dependent aldehyde dehydrogenase